MLGKFVLWVSALSFTGYGLACLLTPTIPADMTGLAVFSGDAYAELAAMYGGLQTGIGVYCALAALRAELYRPALLLLALAIGALALGRLMAVLTGAGDVGFYTWGAMAYEFVTAILAAIALRASAPAR
ncbi:MAG: DUF4345 family protein [Halioglobus sp.]